MKNRSQTNCVFYPLASNYDFLKADVAIKTLCSFKSYGGILSFLVSHFKMELTWLNPRPQKIKTHLEWLFLFLFCFVLFFGMCVIKAGWMNSPTGETQ